ncbi:MAG: hypothetical protein PHI42_01530 [Paludibacteraceae bacterium]|nr:hypothetical protein [Paludibacteraceae bacterium]
MKTIIAVKGNSGTGKSATILKVNEHFKESIITCKNVCDTFDILSVIEVKGHKIGLLSLGDPNPLNQNVHLNLLKDLTTQQCEIILCATRTRGETVDNIFRLNSEDGYNIIWTSNFCDDLRGASFDTNMLNTHFADSIITLIINLLK